MLRYNYIYITLIVFGNIFLACRQDEIILPKLSLRLDLDSVVLLEGQEMFTKVTLENIGCDTANLVPFLMKEDVNGILYILRDEMGNKIHYDPNYFASEGSTSPNLIIPQGDSVSETHDLSGLFRNCETSYFNTLNCLRPGHYSIQAYTIPVIDSLWSNIIEFKVIKSIGEELDALTHLKEIELSRRKNFGDSTFIFKYENFITNFPKSIYVPQVYDRLIFLLKYSQHHNNEEAKRKVYGLLYKFPNYYNSLKYFRSLYYNSTEDEKLELINSILNKYPGTSIAKYCNQLLKQNIK